MSWVFYSTIFCIAFIGAVLLAPMARALAVRVGAMDRPDGPDGRRKIHSKSTPRLGGLVISGALLACGLSLPWLLRDMEAEFVFTTPAKVAAFAAGFAIILALGIYDDIKGARPRMKIAAQTAAMAICFAAGFRIEVPYLSGWIEAVASFPLTWFWMIACINSMNLVDGMDGLASGVAFFAGGVIFIMSAVNSYFGVALASAAMLGSVAGFLVYNFHPAVMFLGDSGSLLLGFLIAVLAMAGSLKSHAALALLIPMLALGLPIADTLLAIIRRTSRKLPISQADREHIHHRLLAMGFTSREAMIILYGACVTFAAGALIMASAGSVVTGLVLVAACLAAVVAVRLLGAKEIEALSLRIGRMVGLGRNGKTERAAARVEEKARQE